MKTKVCCTCKKRRLIKFFDKSSYSNDGYRVDCKKCRKVYREKNKEKIKLFKQSYYKKYPYKLIFLNIKARCNNTNNHAYKNYGERGIKCLITEEEIRQLMLRDGYGNMKKPTIDRIDNNGNYTYENCRFIEKSENSKKDKYIKILQFDLQGNFIKEWESQIEIVKKLNLHQSIISLCINNKRKNYGNYIFKKKGE